MAEIILEGPNDDEFKDEDEDVELDDEDLEPDEDDPEHLLEDLSNVEDID
jgi:hypothetical protein